jgi:cytoskeletal protein CcmA (bactofilin family)
MEADKRTVIDAQTDVEGTLKGKDAQVLGRFSGIIELTGRLILGEGSKVDAQVVADAAEIGGEFKGDLKVRSVVLLEKARVDATVDTQTITVREGAQLNGSVKTGTPPRSTGMSPSHDGVAAGMPGVSVAKG